MEFENPKDEIIENSISIEDSREETPLEISEMMMNKPIEDETIEKKSVLHEDMSVNPSELPTSSTVPTTPMDTNVEEHVEEACCKFCFGEAEPNRPLFHPCRCAGSIRYIHQDCLIAYLRHTRRSQIGGGIQNVGRGNDGGEIAPNDWDVLASGSVCGVCGEKYQFRRVYRADAPKYLRFTDFIDELVPLLSRIGRILCGPVAQLLWWIIGIPLFSGICAKIILHLIVDGWTVRQAVAELPGCTVFSQKIPLLVAIRTMLTNIILFVNGGIRWRIFVIFFGDMRDLWISGVAWFFALYAVAFGLVELVLQTVANLVSIDDLKSKTLVLNRSVELEEAFDTVDEALMNLVSVSYGVTINAASDVRNAASALQDNRDSALLGWAELAKANMVRRNDDMDDTMLTEDQSLFTFDDVLSPAGKKPSCFVSPPFSPLFAPFAPDSPIKPDAFAIDDTLIAKLSFDDEEEENEVELSQWPSAVADDDVDPDSVFNLSRSSIGDMNNIEDDIEEELIPLPPCLLALLDRLIIDGNHLSAIEAAWSAACKRDVPAAKFFRIRPPGMNIKSIRVDKTRIRRHLSTHCDALKALLNSWTPAIIAKRNAQLRGDNTEKSNTDLAISSELSVNATQWMPRFENDTLNVDGNQKFETLLAPLNYTTLLLEIAHAVTTMEKWLSGEERFSMGLIRLSKTLPQLVEEASRVSVRLRLEIEVRLHAALSQSLMDAELSTEDGTHEHLFAPDLFLNDTIQNIPETNHDSGNDSAQDTDVADTGDLREDEENDVLPDDAEIPLRDNPPQQGNQPQLRRPQPEIAAQRERQADNIIPVTFHQTIKDTLTTVSVSIALRSLNIFLGLVFPLLVGQHLAHTLSPRIEALLSLARANLQEALHQSDLSTTVSPLANHLLSGNHIPGGLNLSGSGDMDRHAVGLFSLMTLRDETSRFAVPAASRGVDLVIDIVMSHGRLLVEYMFGLGVMIGVSYTFALIVMSYVTRSLPKAKQYDQTRRRTLAEEAAAWKRRNPGDGIPVADIGHERRAAPIVPQVGIEAVPENQEVLLDNPVGGLREAAPVDTTTTGAFTVDWFMSWAKLLVCLLVVVLAIPAAMVSITLTAVTPHLPLALSTEPQVLAALAVSGLCLSVLLQSHALFSAGELRALLHPRCIINHELDPAIASIRGIPNIRAGASGGFWKFIFGGVREPPTEEEIAIVGNDPCPSLQPLLGLVLSVRRLDGVEDLGGAFFGDLIAPPDIIQPDGNQGAEDDGRNNLRLPEPVAAGWPPAAARAHVTALTRLRRSIASHPWSTIFGRLVGRFTLAVFVVIAAVVIPLKVGHYLCGLSSPLDFRLGSPSTMMTAATSGRWESAELAELTVWRVLTPLFVRSLDYGDRLPRLLKWLVSSSASLWRCEFALSPLAFPELRPRAVVPPPATTEATNDEQPTVETSEIVSSVSWVPADIRVAGMLLTVFSVCSIFGCWILHIPLLVGRLLLSSVSHLSALPFPLSTALMSGGDDLAAYPVGAIATVATMTIFSLVYFDIRNNRLQRPIASSAPEGISQIIWSYMKNAGVLLMETIWFFSYRLITLSITAVTLFSGLPILIGGVLEWMFVAPFTTLLSGGVISLDFPAFPLLRAWLVGIYLQIFLTRALAAGQFGDFPLAAAMEDLLISGLQGFSFTTFLRRVLFPIVIPMFDLLAASLVVSRISSMFTSDHRQRVILARFTLPVVVAMAVVSYFISHAGRVVKNILSRIRDRKYLTGTELMNYETSAADNLST